MDVIELLGKPDPYDPKKIILPDVITLQRVIVNAPKEFADWLKDRTNHRAIPHRFEDCGYVPVRHPTRNDGLWIVHEKRAVTRPRPCSNRFKTRS